MYRIVVATEDDDSVVCKPKFNLVPRVLSPEQQIRVQAVLDEFQWVFSLNPGLSKTGQHRIKTESEVPVFSRPCRLSPQWRDPVKKEIEDLLQLGAIEISDSSWSSPVVPVKKKNGGLRMCIDFRRLNAVTTGDPFYMSLVEEILDQLGEASFLSKIDLCWFLSN